MVSLVVKAEDGATTTRIAPPNITQHTVKRKSSITAMTIKKIIYLTNTNKVHENRLYAGNT